jgi:hypothetical protein
MMAMPQVEPSLGKVLLDSVAYEAPVESLARGPRAQEIGQSASVAATMLSSRKLPTESEAKLQALFGGERAYNMHPPPNTLGELPDKHFSIRLSFSGILFSIMDSSPSEICTVCVKQVAAMARWDHQRTTDASFLMSIGWLQVDNHIPSAPFPVAFCPARSAKDEAVGEWSKKTPEDCNEATHGPPLLFVGIEFAPKHSSGIVVRLRCML